MPYSACLFLRLDFSCPSDGCTDALAYVLVDAIYYTHLVEAESLSMGSGLGLGECCNNCLVVCITRVIEFCHFCYLNWWQHLIVRSEECELLLLISQDKTKSAGGLLGGLI